MGNFNKDITHKEYDTWQIKHTIELNNSLDDLVLNAIDAVKEWYKYEVENNELNQADNLTLDCLIDAINYNGDLDLIIDSEVPIYTHELKGLFFINEDALIEAFNDTGFGERSDFEDGPLGFEGAAVYCYIQQMVLYWVSAKLKTWFSGKFWSVE
jgi:hypothetical protein